MAASASAARDASGLSAPLSATSASHAAAKPAPVRAGELRPTSASRQKNQGAVLDERRRSRGAPPQAGGASAGVPTTTTAERGPRATPSRNSGGASDLFEAFDFEGELVPRARRSSAAAAERVPSRCR